MTWVYIGLLLTIMLGGARLATRSSDAPLFRVGVESGLLFIIVGWILAELRVLSAPVIDSLEMALVIGLGWIGFFFGAQLDLRIISRYPARIYIAATAISLSTMLMVGITVWLLLSIFLSADSAQIQLEAAFMLALCASGSSPAGIHRILKKININRDDRTTISIMSAFDDVPSLIGLGLLYALHQNDFTTGIISLLTPLGIGVLCGIAIHWLFSYHNTNSTNFLLLLGIVCIGSGFLGTQGLSAILGMSIAGATFANLNRGSSAIRRLQAARERDVYIVCLIIAGTTLITHSLIILVGALAYLTARIAGKLLGFQVAKTIFRHLNPRLRWLFICHGGMALLIVVEYEHLVTSKLGQQMASIAIFALIINELLMLWLSKHLQKNHS